MPQHVRRSPSRVNAAAILVILYAMLSIPDLSWMGARVVFGDPVYDSIALSEQRFKEIRTALPPHGTVGYLTDDIYDEGRYYLVQYALAPVVVNRSVEHPLIIVDLRNPDALDNVTREHALVPLHDFGKGLMLFRRGQR